MPFIYALAAFFLLSFTSAHASGFYNPVYSTSQTASRSSLTVARSADVAAINPANIPLLQPGLHFNAGLGVEQRDMGWRGTTVEREVVSGNTPGVSATQSDQVILGTEDTATTETPLDLFPVFQLAKSNVSWGYGFAIKVPFNSSIQWEDDWAGREFVQRELLQNIAFNPSVAIHLEGRHYVAIGYSLNYVRYINDRARVNQPGKEINITAFGWAHNANVSYSGSIGNFFIASNYQTHLPIRMQGNLQSSREQDNTTVDEDTEVDVRFHLPWVWEFALGWKDNPRKPKYEVEFSTNLINWDLFREVSIEFKEALGLVNDFDLQSDFGGKESSEKILQRHRFQRTLGYRLGFQFHANESLILMTGVESSRRVMQDKYLSANMPNGDTTRWGVGLDWKVTPFSMIGMSLVLSRFGEVNRLPNDEEIPDSIVEVPLTGAYSGNAGLFVLNYSQWFP